MFVALHVQVKHGRRIRSTMMRIMIRGIMMGKNVANVALLIITRPCIHAWRTRLSLIQTHAWVVQQGFVVTFEVRFDKEADDGKKREGKKRDGKKNDGKKSDGKKRGGKKPDLEVRYARVYSHAR